MHTFRMPLCFALLSVCSTVASGQLTVTVSPLKITGQKAVVPLTIKNGFGEKVESARAAVFLLDERGKMVGNASRWVIAGSKGSTGLAPGATNIFNFAVHSERPLTSTNLTARVSFSRIVLESGKLANGTRDVQIQRAEK